MRIKALPEDFVVEEQVRLNPADSGPWAVYRVRKVGLTTLEVQTRLAAHLGLSPSKVIFPALKDRQAVAGQYVSLPAGREARIQGEGFVAERVGYRARPLGPADLEGNAFVITVRELAEDEARRLRERLQMLSSLGVPNYYDEQRMGSYAPGWGFIGRAILKRDAREALYGYLAKPFLGDPEPVRRFKRAAERLWPDWRAIMDAAPRPSNYRSVLTYLIDHPEGYRKALNLIPRRLLSIYLSAYQSHLWNRIVGAYLQRVYSDSGCTVAIAGESLPIHSAIAPQTLAELSALRVLLPHHTVAYRDGALGEIALGVLEEEGFAIPDLKARILQRAYLPRGERAVLTFPEALSVEAPVADERFGGWLLRTRFSLPRGSYATLVLKAAMAQSDSSLGL